MRTLSSRRGGKLEEVCKSWPRHNLLTIFLFSFFCKIYGDALCHNSLPLTLSLPVTMPLTMSLQHFLGLRRPLVLPGTHPTLPKILWCLVNHILARPDRETCWSPRLVYCLPLVFFKGFRTSQFISRIFLGQFFVVFLPRTQCNISLCWSICWMFLCWDSMLYFCYSSEMLWYAEMKYYGIPFCPKVAKAIWNQPFLSYIYFIGWKNQYG